LRLTQIIEARSRSLRPEADICGQKQIFVTGIMLLRPDMVFRKPEADLLKPEEGLSESVSQITVFMCRKKVWIYD
jgi:hypothetical protein